MEEEFAEPKIRYEEIPGTIDLGWYYSEKRGIPDGQDYREGQGYPPLVISATGTGKTKFLEFLIQQDIDKGNGFGVIDPHGDLIEDIKSFLACRYDEKEISENSSTHYLFPPH